jgi:hypothetical protein
VNRIQLERRPSLAPKPKTVSDPRIDLARQALRDRLAAATEAQRALASSQKGTRVRSVAQQIFQSRSWAVDQAAAALAALMIESRAAATIPVFRDLLWDLSLGLGLNRVALNYGVSPPGLRSLCSEMEPQILCELDPRATRNADQQIHQLIEALKRDPEAVPPWG